MIDNPAEQSPLEIANEIEKLPGSEGIKLFDQLGKSMQTQVMIELGHKWSEPKRFGNKI